MKKYKFDGFGGLSGHHLEDYRYVVLITLLFFILTYWSYQVFQLNSLSDETDQKGPSSIEEEEFMKKIHSLEKQALTLSQNVLIVDAVKDFSKRNDHYGQTKKVTAVKPNYNNLKKQISYTGISFKKDISGSFFKIHPVLKAYCKKFGFEDLMLIDAKNYRLIYSAKTSPGIVEYIENSIPAKKYNEMIKTFEKNEVESYHMNDMNAAYVASSVKSKGKCIGILLFKITK